MSSILKVDTIQDQSGNNIINENANTITIGASGDTITIPSGATLDASNATLTLPDDSVTTAKIDDGAVTTAKLAYDPNAFRNIFINGDMQIAQRSTSVASITATGYYTVDRMKTAISSLGTWTQSQSTDVPTGQGFASSLKMDCTTADASPSAGDYLLLQQLFEGQNLQYLKKGTANAVSLTASFWVKSTKTGTFILELDDVNNTRQVSAAYTVSVSNTWEKKTITFPADTTGAFTNNNGNSLQLNFWLGAGTTFTSGTLNTTWASVTQANRAVGQVNIADSTSNDWLITGVQLEAGTSASDFEFLPIDVDLGRCQRYFQIIQNSIGASYGTGSLQQYATLSTEMRATPSYSLASAMTATSVWRNWLQSSAVIASSAGTQRYMSINADNYVVQDGSGTVFTTNFNYSNVYIHNSGNILASAEL